MLSDAQVHVLLTETRLQAKLEAVPCAVICLDTEWTRIAGESSDDLPSDAESRQSGTQDLHLRLDWKTNKRNGDSWQRHEAVHRDRRVVSLQRAGRVDAVSLIRVRLFCLGTVGALLYGGRLVVVPYLVSRSPEAFYELLVKEQVTVLNQTPSAFRQLIHAEETARGNPSDLALRLVIFGGEARNAEFEAVVRPARRSTACWSTCTASPRRRYVTYRPLSLADSLEAVSSVVQFRIYRFTCLTRICSRCRWAWRERCMSAAMAVRGYLRQPALTATRFVPHPFSTKPGARLYRTGDLALPDKRRTRIPRPYRSSSQNPWFPYRVRRDRVGAAES